MKRPAAVAVEADRVVAFAVRHGDVHQEVLEDAKTIAGAAIFLPLA